MIETPFSLGFPVGPDVTFAADPHNPEIDEDISLTCYGAVLGQSKSVQKQLSLHSDILKEKTFAQELLRGWMEIVQRIKMVRIVLGVVPFLMFG